MKICGIYKITNKINGKMYIGQSINIKRRFTAHKSAANNKNSASYNYPLYKAIRKYGIENFSFDVIEECSPKELDEKEKFYIEKYNTIGDYGYNQVKPEQGGCKLYPQKILDIILELQNSDLSTEKIGEKFGVSGRTIRSINTGETWYNENYDYPIRLPYTSESQKPIKENHCIDCGVIIYRGALRCTTCSSKAQRVVERPSREELKKMIKEIPFTEIAKKYNVRDNTIRKWCISYNLPSRKKDINSYSDIEWELL